MQSYEHWMACYTNNDRVLNSMSRVLKNDIKVLKLVTKLL